MFEKGCTFPGYGVVEIYFPVEYDFPIQSDGGRCDPRRFPEACFHPDYGLSIEVKSRYVRIGEHSAGVIEHRLKDGAATSSVRTLYTF